MNNKIIISKNTQSIFILIVAILIVSVLNGILGAFKSGEFQKTYDFVSINIELDQVDYSSEKFNQRDNKSKEIIVKEKQIKLNEVSKEAYEIEVYIYKGYYTKYFFQSAWFYSETALSLISTIIFYISFVNYLIGKRKIKDSLYLELSNDINGMVINNELPAVTFEPYIYKWNIDRKKKQHISNIKYKISILEKRTKYEDKKMFYKNGKLNNENDFYLPEIKLTKKQKKYYDAKVNLLNLISESYVKENVEHSNVKYFKFIHPSFVYGGVNKITKTTDSYSSIETDGNKFSKDLIQKIIMGFAGTILITSILSFSLIRTEDGALEIIISVLGKLLPLIIQAVIAINYTNSYMENQIIPNIKNRLNIANFYLSNKKEGE